jgi:hypothetical protein
MIEKNRYIINNFPSSRQATIDIGYLGLRKHHIKALIELDVTHARELIKNYRNQKKEEISFTAGMIGNVKGWVIPVSFLPVCFALGSIVKKPGVFKERIEVREYLQMTILIDHDVIDGAPAARFVTRLTDLIESGHGM